MYLNISSSKDASLMNTSAVGNSSIKKKTREEIRRLKSICFPASQHHQTILEEPLQPPIVQRAGATRTNPRSNTPDAHNGSFSLQHPSPFAQVNQTYFFTNPDVHNESSILFPTRSQQTQQAFGGKGDQPQGLSMFYESPVADVSSHMLAPSPMITQPYTNNTMHTMQDLTQVPMTPKFEQASKLANSMLNFIMKITRKLNELCLTSQNSKLLR